MSTARPDENARSRGKARRLMVDADRMLGEADENLTDEAARDALALARRALSLALTLSKREGE